VKSEAMAKRNKVDHQPQEYIERRHETSAGGVVWRRKDGKLQIVMARPAGKDAWVLPKGQPNPKESLIETATRETREETGLEVTPSAPVGKISYVFSWRDSPGKPLVRIFKNVHYFLMEPVGGSLDAHDHEMDEVRWMDIDEAEHLASYKSDREIIVKARAMLMEQ
jgi:8-oxo-dGTP pyrophosphatase MutT (NUDIX family)